MYSKIANLFFIPNYFINKNYIHKTKDARLENLHLERVRLQNIIFFNYLNFSIPNIGPGSKLQNLLLANAHLLFILAPLSHQLTGDHHVNTGLRKLADYSTTISDQSMVETGCFFLLKRDLVSHFCILVSYFKKIQAKIYTKHQGFIN